MDSGDGSGPKQRRTRQQFLKYCADFTEKRNRSCQNGNLTPSSSPCSVNIGKEGVSCGRKRKMAVSEGDKRKMGKWSEDARKLRKGKKKVDNGRRSKFSPGTCESIMERIFVEEIPDDDVTDDSEDDSDDVDIIEEEEGVNNESGSGWWSNTGLKSNMLNAKDQEVVSSTSSMCGRTPVKSVEVYTDSTSSSESESDSEASSDEDNDDPEDKNYRLIESSSSSQYDDVISDFDDTESEDEKNEEGEKESNEGLVPELVVESKKQKKGGAYLLRARSLSMSKKKKLNNGNDSSSPILLTDEEEFDEVGSDGEESKSEEECEVDDSVKNVVQKDVVRKDRRTGKKILEDSEFMKFVVDSIINVDDHDKLTPFEEKEQVPVKETLPLVFRFEDEDEPPPPEKEEWEKEVENLFAEMQMCILESDIGFTNPSVSPMQSGDLSNCQMGNHQLVLDEQIGLAQRTRGRYERKHLGQSPSLLDVGGFRFSDSSAVQDSMINEEGTVWDLVPPSAKSTMYPHQRGGFEFMWKNVAGDINLERLRQPLSDSKGGCIISHPPGTGKTRLTIVFLQSYLKLFPKSRPVIIAPSSLLLNWEAEFQKWEAQRTRGRYERKHLGQSPSLLDVGGFRFSDSSAVQDSMINEEGTVWDLVPPSAKSTMYPHQRGGFEFMWKNVAGDINLERLRQPLSDSKGGCIISHPPGTGKTRLTIVFLQSYLKLFPKSRPVIIAPSSLLLNWEAEFQKWEVDIPFHNLNSKDFSLQEDEATVSVFRCLSHAGKRNPHLIRMVKLGSWVKGKSVLGISYDLFRILTGDDGDGYAKPIREILLKYPGLLVLEEGHTARNEQSLVWKALKKVETEKRIVLSGTPFQNNIKELYNTLCVVSPKFAADLEQKWVSLSSSIDKNARALEELRDIISPLVHKCSENVKKVSLPGIRDTVIHLKPTDLQKELLRRIPENPSSFYEQNLVSLISVHPSLVAKRKEFSDLESQLTERGCRLDPDTGVKMKFVVELIRLCGGRKERVIIFSQLLDPLNLIKEQLNSLFGWTLGREILYMDGKLDVKQRQISINSLNDPKSDVKVLLASIKACSEGISLIGASRVVLLDVLWNPSVEQQAISRAYRNGQTKFVHVYCPVTSKWEVDKIEQQTRKKYHSDVLLSRDHEAKMDPSCSVSEDNILESMVEHEGLRHIFEKLSHAPRVVPPNTGLESPKPSS
ncbi:SNF2 domain-containing protein CLASSY 4-like [Solanum tuberosum]|uniref:SNF2 domain-containing protein CLASSY 4-like n=1 Tax=Solanum tuberosum TaxID=4113 RepID=UPI00073A390D|nr:PREDICTED: SNF2 domain-containing protein CLASSY 4-like [Solanum tuberosum]